MTSTTKAISINAYWAWAIREGHKRVENRTWRTNHRGPLLIHASMSDEHDATARAFLEKALGAVPPTEEIERLRGCIVARCDLTGVDDYAPLFEDNPWAWGPICWQLENVRPLPPVPTRGLPGLFHVDIVWADHLCDDWCRAMVRE